MRLKDCSKSGHVYHVAPVTDLKKILESGIKYDDKSTYFTKYIDFHKFIDSFKPENIPDWVVREHAIFASISFDEDHSWHSHSVILKVQVCPERCWVANENLANGIYEPFILQDIKGFEAAREYLSKKGKKDLEMYWSTSLSYTENIYTKKQSESGYDAEVMIFHDILPEDIEILKITSDHRIMTVEQWLDLFKYTII